MTTETTPNTSAGKGAPLPASQSALPPANGKRKRALLALLAIVLVLGIEWLGRRTAPVRPGLAD